VLCLAGCISAPETPPVRYYVLGDVSTKTAAAAPPLQGKDVLLVSPTTVAAFYDTQRLVYSRAEGERGYYQFAAWTERPGRTLAELLCRRLGVSSTTSGIRGDVILHTRLEEIYHDAREGAGTARVVVAAELVNSAGRRVGDMRRFTANVPAASPDAAGAVAATNRAVGAVVDDIAAWIAATPL
jgi:cholesterol transport system auxiliary component